MRPPYCICCHSTRWGLAASHSVQNIMHMLHTHTHARTSASMTRSGVNSFAALGRSGAGLLCSACCSLARCSPADDGACACCDPLNMSLQRSGFVVGAVWLGS